MKSFESAIEALKVVVAEAMESGQVHVLSAAASSIEALHLAQVAQQNQ